MDYCNLIIEILFKHSNLPQWIDDQFVYCWLNFESFFFGVRTTFILFLLLQYSFFFLFCAVVSIPLSITERIPAKETDVSGLTIQPLWDIHLFHYTIWWIEHIHSIHINNSSQYAKMCCWIEATMKNWNNWC